LCLTAVAGAAWAQTYQAPAAQRGSSTAIQAEAWQIVELANRARAAVGAGPLKWDPALATAARQHCLRMAAEGPIAHQYRGELELSERAGLAGAHFSMIEENVAIGPTPGAIHDEWMRSSGHRANLLNPDVDRVGVAVAASRGVLYAVADYEHSVAPLTQAQVETAIGRLLRGSGVMLREDATDARAYCAQGRDAEGSSQPGFRMMWQGAELTRLPQKLLERLATGRYNQAAVGSCPAQDLGGAFTGYRVAVLLY
jgi:hypothetical protein